MPDVKISDATPVDVLYETDLVPIARVGTDIALNATLGDIAEYVTVLASSHPPAMSNLPETAGVMPQYARADHVHPTDASRAPIDSPEFIGKPTAPTPLSADSSDALATTEFVHELAQSGTLRTQTPGIDDNSELVATTEYVQNQASTQPPLMDGLPTAGVSQRFSRGDHIHPSDNSRAPVSAIPVASDATPTMAGSAVPGSATAFARGDHVHPTDTSRYPASNPANFQTASQIASALAGYAPLASPSFTGDPRAPTPAPTDSDTSVATTAFVRTGTTAGDDAAPGQVGEFQSAQLLSTNAVAVINGADVVLVTLPLPAGDWDVWGSVGFTMTSNNNTTLKAWLNAGGTIAPSIDQMGGNVMNSVANNTPQSIVPVPPMRVSRMSPVAIALGSTGATGGGTIMGWGKIMARRRR